MALPPPELLFLRRVWRELCLKYNSPQMLVNQFFEEIVQAYWEPQRFYHTLLHIRHIVELIFEHKTLVNSEEALLFAAFYHDFVYHTHSYQNEEKSAEYAEKCLQQLLVDNELISKVSNIIVSTKTHDCQINDSDCALFLDFDLHILSVSATEFAEYEKNIRNEYTWVEEEIFWQKRTQILSYTTAFREPKASDF